MSIFSIGVVAHQDRYERATKLADYIEAELVTVDSDGKLGAGANHERCYEWLYETTSAPWCVILEDDAIPVKDFRNQLNLVLRAAPTGLVSLYLGRTRPGRWQPSISQVIGSDRHFLLGTELLHHVAVAVHTPLIPSLLAHIRSDRSYQLGRLPIDEAVGRFARAVGIKVAYTHPSICDHDTRMPTVITRHVSSNPGDSGKRPANEIRKAWAFGSRKAWQPVIAAIPEPA